jgi:hypothetical protein
MATTVRHYMKIVVMSALALAVGMALAQLEGAIIAFSICVFVIIVVILYYR